MSCRTVGTVSNAAQRVASVIEAWGSSAEERAADYPCDEFVTDPALILYRAVDVDAPAELVFRWLCQIRVAPYSYDWIDNFGRRSPGHLIEGLDQLELGQRFNIFRLVHFEPGRSITLDSTTPAFGRVVMTYRAVPAGADRCRLVAKLVVVPPRNLYGLLTRWILPAGDLVMMRKQLLRFKALAEKSAR
jgi:hypothetical protein